MKTDFSTMTSCYSKSVYGDLYLTKNFQVKEFACKDGSDPVLVNIMLPLICQAVRNWFGYPYSPNSAYRTITHNANEKGSSNSLHIYGDAVDIPRGNVSARELYNFLDRLLGDSCELIYYSWGCHVGVQDEKERYPNGI